MTKKYVITGPSSCGKSTVVEYLGNQGFFVVGETARTVLEKGEFHPSRSVYLFQQAIAREQIKAEESIQKENPEIAFLDRGFHDITAFCRHFGVLEIPPEVDRNAFYDGVFFLEMIPKFEQDGIRVEKNLEEALKIFEAIREEYKRLGISCVSVPFMTPEERGRFILREIKKKR